MTIQRETNSTERYGRHVGGPTMMMRRSVAQRLRFLRRRWAVDVTLYRRAIDHGYQIYSTHAFGFVLNRHGKGHTWQTDHSHFLDVARGTWRGLQLEVMAVGGGLGV
jgi:hypothetical protein